MLACADLHSYDPPLDNYDFSYANLCQANLRGAQLRDANFHQAILAKADLSGAHLEGANFCRTDLYETKFEKAWLTGANLQGVQLAKTNLRGAHLVDCKIYGMSAWDVRLDGDEQKRFIIRYQSGGRRRAKAEEKVEVEDLDLAAFTYLTLHNHNISRVFDTAARKWVLLLGRFSTRKNVLEQLAEALRKRDLIPIIFDFPRPQQRDLVETLLLLAGLSAFVVVDITSPRSTPLELQAIASNYGVPIVPIMKTGTKPFGMFSGLGKFRWILAPLEYDSPEQLIAGLDKAVINPAAAKSQRLINWKEDEPRIRRVRDFLT